MRPIYAFSLLIVLMLAACAAPTAAPTPFTNSEGWVRTETFAVYDEIIRSEYGSTTVVVRPTNMQARIAEDADPALQTSTARTFNRLNQDILAIEDNFSDEFNITFLGKSEFEAFFPEGGDRDTQWDAFYDQYAGSGGYLQLSRVAFSDDGTQALVRYTWQGRTDMEFCIDQVLLFEDQDGAWQVVDTLEEINC